MPHGGWAETVDSTEIDLAATIQRVQNLATGGFMTRSMHIQLHRQPTAQRARDGPSVSDRPPGPRPAAARRYRRRGQGRGQRARHWQRHVLFVVSLARLT